VWRPSYGQTSSSRAWRRPTPLVPFNGADGAKPDKGLTCDAAGDLFGTTVNDSAIGAGTVF
jgi:hypothetical protein